jgi:hypothetical protein
LLGIIKSVSLVWTKAKGRGMVSQLRSHKLKCPYLRCRLHGPWSAVPELDPVWILWGRRWHKWKGGHSQIVESPVVWPWSCSNRVGPEWVDDWCSFSPKWFLQT